MQIKITESSKVHKAYVTRCSNSHFFFSIGTVHRLKLFRASPSRLLIKTIPPWLETTLPATLSWYPLQDIFDAYEFGLFCQCVPNKTYHFKNEQCTGGTLSEVKLTGMAEVNVNGERLPMVIGKSKTPRYFKGVKNVPCCYRAQPKSWISSELFEERVKEIDRNFGDQKRKITLIIDNCPAHPDVPAID